MKIAIDARFYGTEHTGLGRYTMNFLNELKQLKEATKHEYALLLRSKYMNLKFPDNFRLIEVDIPHYTIQEQIMLPIILKKLNPDIIHSMHFNIPIMTTTPFIVTMHDLIKSHFKSRKTTTKPHLTFALKRLGYNAVVKNAIHRSKLIITPSNSVKADIVDMYGTSLSDKIIPIYESIDPNLKTQPSQRDISETLSKYSIAKKYIIYVGNAYPHKNIQTIIKAFMKIRNKAGIDMVIVSKRNKFLDYTIQQSGIQPKDIDKYGIHIISNASDRDLTSLYSGATLTLTATLMEGFSFIALESIHLGTPALISDIPVHREIYGDSVYYADPNSYNDYANKILKYTKTKTKPLISKLPRKYSWKKLAKEILDAYEKASAGI